MKNFLYIIVILVFVSSAQFPQERDSLIQLYSGIGDTIDFVDREIFGFYPDIDGYKYSQLFERDRKYLVSKITYLDDGVLRDTVIIEDFSQLFFLRQNLSKFKLENDKKFESPFNVSVFTKAGNNYDGKLEMFSKSYLFLYSDLDYIFNRSSRFNKIPFLRIDSLIIQGFKPNVGPYIGYGALAGSVLGLGIGLYWINTENFWEGYGIYIVGITTLIGAGVGALFGWVIGETLPPDIINVRFNSPYDVIKLKDYSAYYFQYDQLLEEKYVEIE